MTKGLANQFPFVYMLPNIWMWGTVVRWLSWWLRKLNLSRDGIFHPLQLCYFIQWNKISWFIFIGFLSYLELLLIATDIVFSVQQNWVRDWIGSLFVLPLVLPFRSGFFWKLVMCSSTLLPTKLIMLYMISNIRLNLQQFRPLVVYWVNGLFDIIRSYNKKN